MASAGEHRHRKGKKKDKSVPLNDDIADEQLNLDVVSNNESEIDELPIPAQLEGVALDNKVSVLSNRDRDLQDKRFKAVYNAVKGMIIGKKFSVSQLTIMVPLSMEVVADIQSMSGEQKIQMLMKVFTYLIAELDFESPEQEQLARHFVEYDLDVLMQAAYQASKGKFPFKVGVTDETYDPKKLDLIYNNIRQMIVTKEIDIKTIVILVPTVMVQVAGFVNLTGLQKKELVTQIISRLVQEFKPKNNDEQMIQLFIQKQLPFIIDVVYAAAQSKYVFKIVESGWKKLLACCRH